MMKIEGLKRLSEITIDEMMARDILMKNREFAEILDTRALNVYYNELENNFTQYIRYGVGTWEIDIPEAYCYVKIYDAQRMMFNLANINPHCFITERMKILVEKGEKLAYRLDCHSYQSNTYDAIENRLECLASEIVDEIKHIVDYFYTDYWNSTYQTNELMDNFDFDDFFIDDNNYLYRIQHMNH